MIERLVGVAHDREIRHRHHRAVRLGVDADDVRRGAQSARVLHRTAHTERHVQGRVDDHTGRTDLMVVADPAAIGDHAGGPHHTADGPGELCELGETLRRVESGTAPDDVPGLGQIHRADVRRQHVDHHGVGRRRVGFFDREVAWAVGHHGLARKRFGAAYAGLQCGDERPVGMYLVEFETTAAGDVHHGGGHGGGASEQLAAERGSQPRRQIATIGRSGQHDLVGVGNVGEERDERRRPSSHGERSELHAADVGREAVERHRSRHRSRRARPGRRTRRSSRRRRPAGRPHGRVRARSSNLNVRPMGSRSPIRRPRRSHGRAPTG